MSLSLTPWPSPAHSGPTPPPHQTPIPISPSSRPICRRCAKDMQAERNSGAGTPSINIFVNASKFSWARASIVSATGLERDGRQGRCSSGAPPIGCMFCFDLPMFRNALTPMSTPPPPKLNPPLHAPALNTWRSSIIAFLMGVPKGFHVDQSVRNIVLHSLTGVWTSST